MMGMGIKFANVFSDTDESEAENTQLYRVNTTTSFTDEFQERIRRQELEEESSRGKSPSEDVNATADFASVSESWKEDALKKAIPLAAGGGNHQQGKKPRKNRKQKIKAGEKVTTPPKKARKTTANKISPITLPKTYASVEEDLTYIPRSLAGAIPAIDWKDTMKTSDNAKRSDALAPESFRVTGVLGRGKGTERSLPKYEYESLWQYMIPSNDAKKNAPWGTDPTVPPADVKLKILSVVSCVSLGIPLNLELVAERGFDLHYFPDSFTPLVMRLKSPVATAMMFKSGKMVVTGTKTERDNRVATFKLCRKLQRMGFPVRPLWCKIQNLTATCNLGFRVRVHLLAQMRGVVSQYHPELFTGVTIIFTIPRAKAILFRTGSILITGVKSEKEAETVLRKVYPLAKLFAN